MTDTPAQSLLQKTISALPKAPPLIVFSGMPGAGKARLAKKIFPDFASCDLFDELPGSPIQTEPWTFFSNNAPKLIINNADLYPEILRYLPEPASGKQIVLIGNFHKSVLLPLIQGGKAAIFWVDPSPAGSKTAVRGSAFAITPEPVRISYPEIGFFDSVRNGGLPRPQSLVTTGRFYADWLSEFFRDTVERRWHVEKTSQFMAFLKALARSSASEINHSVLAKEAGVSYRTAMYWAEFLLEAGVLFEIPSLVLGVRRQVRRSKVLFSDSGLQCFLLGIRSTEEMVSSPYYENIIESCALAAILKSYRSRGLTPEVFYYRDTSGKTIPCVIQTNYGYVPVGFLTQNAQDPAKVLREMGVLSRIGLRAADPVFLTDGTVVRESSDIALVSISDIG